MNPTPPARPKPAFSVPNIHPHVQNMHLGRAVVHGKAPGTASLENPHPGRMSCVRSGRAGNLPANPFNKFGGAGFGPPRRRRTVFYFPLSKGFSRAPALERGPGQRPGVLSAFLPLPHEKLRQGTCKDAEYDTKRRVENGDVGASSLHETRRFESE